MTRVDTKWGASDSGTRYSTSRFASSRARGRDARLVSTLLGRQGVSLRENDCSVLDVPCGTGRLRDVLETRQGGYVAVDRSLSMLAENEGSRVLADATTLPFREDEFDVVVCCRLLHHLPAAERKSVVEELVRVSRTLVIASFWDACSYHSWRRRTGLRRARHEDTRLSASRADIEADFNGVGARVVGYAASMRFVSPQTFVAVRVDGT